MKLGMSSIISRIFFIRGAGRVEFYKNSAKISLFIRTLRKPNAIIYLTNPNRSAIVRS
jgi:hypothetical protein